MESRGDAVKVCVVLRLKPVYKHQNPKHQINRTLGLRFRLSPYMGVEGLSMHCLSAWTLRGT